MNHLSCIVNTTAADGPVMQGARALAAMISMKFLNNTVTIFIPSRRTYEISISD